MHVRCPHCQNAIEIVEDSDLASLTCPSCGSGFGLTSEQATLAPRELQLKVMGRFELVDKIGMGAFGTVWKARDLHLDRSVAVKIPRKGQLSPEESEQFLREARAAAQLKHPNIVAVHEVGRDGDTIYIVSDLIAGCTLADQLTSQRLSVEEAVELCITVAEALHAAHELGVVHRDIKPSNIMLDHKRVPHLMDFGLAKREAGEITMTVEGRLLGTPAYMSPEQARGEGHDADRRSDVYSLGVILYELLTGERPFRGNVNVLIQQVINDEAPSPRKFNAKLPKDLETICLKCLERAPEKRYATAADFSAELRRWQRQEPILTRPISRIERGWRWCKRNPRVALWSSAFFVAVTAGSIVSLYFGIVATKERNDANYARNAALKNLTLAIEKEQLANAAQKSAHENMLRAEENEKKADLERERAQQERDVAKAVRTFLQDKLLRQASVWEQVNSRQAGSPDRDNQARYDITVRELLDNAASHFSPEQIAVEFPNQPIVQAEILETVAETYDSIGNHDGCLKFIDAAAKIRLEQIGPREPSTLAAMANRGFLYLSSRKHAVGIAIILSVITDLHELCEAADTDQQRIDADQALDAVLDAVERRLDPSRFVLPDVSLGLSDTALTVVHLINTLPQLEHLAQVVAAKYGPRHPRTLYANLVLAFAYHGTLQLDKAISLYESIEQSPTLQSADAELRRAALQIILALAYRAKQINPTQAQELEEKGSLTTIRLLGPNHPMSLVCAGRLAKLYLRNGKYELAIEQLSRNFDTMSAGLGLANPNTIGSGIALADACIQAKQTERAMSILKAFLDDPSVVSQIDVYELHHLKSWLAGCHIELGQPAEAIPLLVQCKDAVLKKYPNEFDITQLFIGLEKCYVAIGDIESANATLDDAIEQMLANQFSGLGIEQQVNYLCQRLEQTRSLAKSEELRRKFILDLERRRETSGRTFTRQLSSLGRDLIKQHKFDAAEIALKRCMTLMIAGKYSSWEKGYNKCLIGRAAFGKFDNENAERLFIEGIEQMTVPVEGISVSQKRQLEYSLYWCIKLYESLGEPEEAAKWQQRLDDLVFVFIVTSDKSASDQNK